MATVGADLIADVTEIVDDLDGHTTQTFKACTRLDDVEGHITPNPGTGFYGPGGSTYGHAYGHHPNQNNQNNQNNQGIQNSNHHNQGASGRPHGPHPHGQYVGNVKWFSDTLNYGFITMCEGVTLMQTGDGDHPPSLPSGTPAASSSAAAVAAAACGRDIFVHHTGVQPHISSYKTLRKGEYVSMNLCVGSHGPQAIDVTGVAGGPLMCDADALACINGASVMASGISSGVSGMAGNMSGMAGNMSGMGACQPSATPHNVISTSPGTGTEAFTAYGAGFRGGGRAGTSHGGRRVFAGCHPWWLDPPRPPAGDSPLPPLTPPPGFGADHGHARTTSTSRAGDSGGWSQTKVGYKPSS